MIKFCNSSANTNSQGGEITVIVGELVIAESGKLFFNGREVKPITHHIDSEATTIAGLKDDFNELLAKLQASRLMETKS